MEIRFEGIGVSPGIAIGTALAFDVRRIDVPRFSVTDCREEVNRLNGAIDSVREDLTVLYRRTAAQLGETHADIFKAHLMLLDDVVLREEVARRVEAEQVNVEYVLDDFVQRYAAVMRAAEDPRFRERTADLLDVLDRVLGRLLDAERPDLKNIAQPSIIVAHQLAPSDAANMDFQNILAVALDTGGASSHTAIIARALEIPAVMGVEGLSRHCETGATVIVDGIRGLVILRPGEETLNRYSEMMAQLEQQWASLVIEDPTRTCRTSDGAEIPLLANVELPFEVDHSVKAHAQGIGLYRTEYLFLNRTAAPTEEEQYTEYIRAAKQVAPNPLILRTMDVGGDKFVSYLNNEHEGNPQMGWRAVRFCLERPDIFRAQLRAILRASVNGNVQIMFPMISGVNELRQVKAVLNDVRNELQREGIPIGTAMKVGSMIEVPSAVAVAPMLAQECDFFSIGTNDLIQYSLAVDRENTRIAHLYEPAHPAVLRMLRWTTQAARDAEIPCGICGEMAGDPLYTELLIGLGVGSLSMSTISIPVVRQVIARISLDSAAALVEEALTMPTSAEVKSLLQKRLDTLGLADLFMGTARHARQETIRS